MVMHLEWGGGRFVAAMAVLLAVAGNAAFAQEHKTYRCNVADVADWVVEDGGHMRLNSRPRSGWAGHLLQQFDGVIIDTLTGAMTHPDGNREVWSVVQRGDSGNDYVLTQPTPLDPLEQIIPPERRITPSEDKIKARAATDFIRIRTWSEKPMPMARLLAFGLSGLASGPCELVR